MFHRNTEGTGPRFRHGDLVEVRAWDEILATLDAEGQLEGLPFMPEMGKYCGKRLRVYRRAEGVYLDGLYYMAGLTRTVLLEDVRCDGSAHDDCPMRCLLLWKEVWLRPASGRRPTDSSAGEELGVRGIEALNMVSTALTPCPSPAARARGDNISCQATALVKATTRLPWWSPLQYLRILQSGDRSVGELLRMMLTTTWNKMRWRLGLAPQGTLCGSQTRTPDARLNLQPGELVRVKSREEIEATLDSRGRNRGLGFAPEMLRFCGGTYRVARPIAKAVSELTGQTRPIRNTVALEGVTCSGIAQRCCPRACYHLWREIWLTRVPEST